MVEVTASGRLASVLRSRDDTSAEANTEGNTTKGQMSIITVCLAYSTGITTYLSGIVTIATPAIASDLDLPPGLVLW